MEGGLSVRMVKTAQSGLCSGSKSRAAGRSWKPGHGQEEDEESIWCPDVQQLSLLMANLVKAHPRDSAGLEKL